MAISWLQERRWDMNNIRLIPCRQLSLNTVVKMLSLVACFLLIGCADHKNEVVVYTSVDQVYAEPILQAFENQTGVSVKAVYDVEAAKTIGLEKRLIAEAERPRADVFWNSEHLRTISLAKKGLLASYTPLNAEDINPEYKDKDGRWVGLGIRARIFIINNDLLLDDRPTTLEDMFKPKWNGKVAVARPLFGTTSTHFSALRIQFGEEKFNQFLRRFRDSKVALLSGNSHVRDEVVRGKYYFGLTDTDDANVAIRKGENVSVIYLNQKGRGSFAVFQTISVIKHAPHQSNAKLLVEYLASEDVEQRLIDSGAVQLSTRKGSEAHHIKLWTDSSDILVDQLSSIYMSLKEIF